MIRIRGLRLDSPAAAGSPVSLLDIPDLNIRYGECIALVGANGAGKSLLLQILAGLKKLSAGEIAFDKSDGSRNCGLLLQNPEDQLVGSTVERDLAFGLENRGVPPGEIRQRVDRALAEADLFSLARRPPHLLSDGEKQRVALASTLVLEPAILLLDEPAARLDADGRRRLQDRLSAERARGDRTILQVSHRSEEVMAADRVVGLAAGRVVFDGTPTELANSGEADRLGILGTGHASDRSHLVSRPDRIAPRSDLVKLRGVEWRSDDPNTNGTNVLDGVELTIRAGESVGLMGRSGAGKTVLATILADLLPPTGGTIEWAPRTAPTAQRDRPRVALAFQEPERGFFEETVLTDVSFGPRNLGLSEEASHRRATDALQKVGLDPEVFGARDPLTLSGGEARRAALAGILAMESALVILDEPTTGLDAAGWSKLRDLLATLREEGVATLVVSHERELLVSECERVAVLDAGRIQAEVAAPIA